jgi:hypothetical protein
MGGAFEVFAHLALHGRAPVLDECVVVDGCYPKLLANFAKVDVLILDD